MGRWDYWHAPLLAFAWFAVAMGLPYLLVGPLAGSLIGRTDTRTALIASNLERGLANILSVLAPNRLLVLIALRSSADTFFTPAKQAALQSLAPGPLAMAANGTSHAINQAAKIVVPSLGGLALLWLLPSCS